MTAMNFIFFVLFGFVIGQLARLLLPGGQSHGLLWTTVLGIGGSLAGNFVARAISSGGGGLHPGYVGSLIGALGLLTAYVHFARRRAQQV